MLSIQVFYDIEVESFLDIYERRELIFELKRARELNLSKSNMIVSSLSLVTSVYLLEGGVSNIKNTIH